MCWAVVDNGREGIDHSRADQSRVDASLSISTLNSQTLRLVLLSHSHIALPPGSRRSKRSSLSFACTHLGMASEVVVEPIDEVGGFNNQFAGPL